MSNPPVSDGALGAANANATQRSANLASIIYKDPTFNKNLVTKLSGATGAAQSQSSSRPSSPQQTAELVLKDANSSSTPKQTSPTGAKSPMPQVRGDPVAHPV